MFQFQFLEHDVHLINFIQIKFRKCFIIDSHDSIIESLIILSIIRKHYTSKC